MKEIQLGGKHGNGLVTLVDDEDYELVSSLRWFAQPDGNTTYALRRPNREVPFRSVHRLLAGVTDRDILVDHRNRNGLDNRRSNIRIATHAQNAFNRKFKADYGYRGVCWHKKHGKYISSLKVDGYMHFLGYYDDPVEAALVYDKAARLHHGEFASLNFPDQKAA